MRLGSQSKCWVGHLLRKCKTTGMDKTLTACRIVEEDFRDLVQGIYSGIYLTLIVSAPWLYPCKIIIP